MSPSSKAASCPCGLARLRDHCCGPYLHGEADAPTAEALMRSRFVAYCESNRDYLIDTWHADTCPVDLSFEGDDLRWTRLEVVHTEAGGLTDTSGVVEFKAHYRSGRKAGILHERSRFIRSDSRWVYVDGDLSPQAARGEKVGRNEPCPCGSTQKYKRCCGRGVR